MRGNLISGIAKYGLLADEGAQNCKTVDDDMAGLVAILATIGHYGPHTFDNAAAGVGTYIEAEGAHDNVMTGYMPAQPVLRPVPPGLRSRW